MNERKSATNAPVAKPSHHATPAASTGFSLHGQPGLKDPHTVPLWARLTATFFGVGWRRPGPGTWASAATTLLWAAVTYFVPAHARPAVAAVLALCVTLVGIPASTQVARASGLKDPGFIVIDEVAGQLISFIAVPLNWKSLLLGFILFRAFDILKPPPVRQLEKIPEGAGIVLDDIGAGIYALLVMHLLRHFGILIR